MGLFLSFLQQKQTPYKKLSAKKNYLLLDNDLFGLVAYNYHVSAIG
jgi:hypothetical protein